MTARCLGKRPALDDARDLLARDYLDVAAAVRGLPKRFGHGLDFLGDAWGMLGNAGAGDCCFAGGAHEEMVDAKAMLSEDLLFTDESVLSDYSAVTGYDPNDPSTDQGTFVREFMGYRQKVGLIDGVGNRHKIGPYLSIDPRDWDLMLACVYSFGAVGIGFNFPRSAWQQFDNGEPWSVVPGSPYEGGHYVPILGTMNAASEATCVTWSRRQILTREFYAANNDEAWAYVPGITRPDGTSFHHVDVERLHSDLEALRKR